MLPRLFFLLLSFAVFSWGAPVPYWSQPFLDPLIVPYGGAQLLANVSWQRLYFATSAVGVNAMSPMLSFLNGRFFASWKLSYGPEDAPGQKVMYAASSDGVSWLPGSVDGTNVAFPPMNSSENPGVALFAEPTLFINGRVYAAASPIQFCLYPYPFAPPRLLLLRRVLDAPAPLGSLGPLFWASATIPPGFGEASAANNVTALGEQDAQTQADVATLTPDAVALPCDISGGGTTKCEACAGGCQPWAAAFNASASIENERSHYRALGGGVDVILYRSKLNALFASTRTGGPGGNWSEPRETNITDDVANINCGNLPDGRAYLVSNAMPNVFRDPLFLSLSSDGFAFDAVAAIGSCEQNDIFANPPEQPWGCLPRFTIGSINGLQYAQAAAVTAPQALAGLYCIVSQNREDIWVARVPFASIPA